MKQYQSTVFPKGLETSPARNTTLQLHPQIFFGYTQSSIQCILRSLVDRPKPHHDGHGLSFWVETTDLQKRGDIGIRGLSAVEGHKRSDLEANGV